jgi:PAS domain-containing protein
MSQDKFQILFDRSSDPHIIFDATGITDCNDAMIRLLGAPDKSRVLSLQDYDEETQKMWQRTRFKDRAQAIIAHELAEHQYDGDHELALIAGPETELPISHAARELLRQMEKGWRGR